LFVDLIRSARPRHWVKNVFVLAAPLFSGHLFLQPDLTRALIALGLFIAVSSAIYLINDITDREQDRLHPLKASRPIASGRLRPTVAGFVAGILLLTSVVAAYGLAPGFAYILGGYALIHLAYSVWLKKLVLLDVLAIAAGFLLRAIGGAVAVDVVISTWFVLCTFTLTLLLATVKRRQELIELGESASQHRHALEGYDVAYLDQVVSILTAASIVCYALYAVGIGESASAQGHMEWTVPLVIYGILRYLYIVRRLDIGGDPTALLWRDRPLQLTVLLWGALSSGLIYAGI